VVSGVVFAAPVSAAVVTYEWVQSSQTRTAGLPATTPVGFLTFNSASIIDPANFSGVPMSALVNVSFSFNSLGVTISPSDIATETFVSPSTAFSASGGFLTTDFRLSKLVVSPVFNLNLNGNIFNPGGATSTAVLQIATPQGTKFESDVGDWKLEAVPVPLPAAWVLMLSSVFVLAWSFRHKRPR
jgi:hypothetical protein